MAIDIAVDGDSIPYTICRYRLYRLEGDRFVEMETGEASNQWRFIRLLGGNTGRVCAVAAHEGEHRLRFYEVDLDGVRLLTELEYAVPSAVPETCLTKRGWIYVSGLGFLAVFDGETWHRIDGDVQAHVAVFDLGGKVFLYRRDNRCYLFDRDEGLREIGMPEWKGLVPGQVAWSLGAQWGDGTPLIISRVRDDYTGFSFDPETMGPGIDDSFDVFIDPDLAISDMFPAADGSIWLLASPRKKPDYGFYRMDREGSIERTLAAPRQLAEWVRKDGFPRGFLLASDGSMWFSLPARGVAVFRNGAFTCYDWGYGFPGRVAALQEDAESAVWCVPAYQGAARFKAGGEPVRPSGPCADWQRFQILHHVWKTSEGHIVLVRQETPFSVMRWDGSGWESTDLPFDISKAGYPLVSNRGHLVVERGGKAFLASGGKVTEWGSTREALLAAARDGGLESWENIRGFRTVLVLPGPRIWSVGGDTKSIGYYDGERWDNLPLGDYAESLFPSDEYGMLILTGQGRLYTYDTGVFVQLEKRIHEMERIMIGRYGRQPYERSMVGKNPMRYLPVLQVNTRQYLIPRFEDLDAAEPLENVPDSAVRLPENIVRAGRADALGWWLYPRNSREQAIRLVGRELIPFRPDCRYFDSGMSFFDLQEDATGNTWVTVGPPYSQTHAAVHWLAGAKLEMPDIPETCGRELRVDPESPRSPNGDGPHILSRVDGGEWVIPAESSAPVFRFREGGKHLCELRALLPSGEALPDSVEFEVEAEVPLPETALGGPGPFLVDSLTWEPPVSALPSSPGEEPRLEYRIDEGPWREMTQEGAVSFVGSATGDHEIEVTAVEEGFWRDPTPVILEVEYDLDFEKVVESASRPWSGFSQPTGRMCPRWWMIWRRRDRACFRSCVSGYTTSRTFSRRSRFFRDWLNRSGTNHDAEQDCISEGPRIGDVEAHSRTHDTRDNPGGRADGGGGRPGGHRCHRALAVRRDSGRWILGSRPGTGKHPLDHIGQSPVLRRWGAFPRGHPGRRAGRTGPAPFSWRTGSRGVHIIREGGIPRRSSPPARRR